MFEAFEAFEDLKPELARAKERCRLSQNSIDVEVCVLPCSHHDTEQRQY